MTTRAALPVAVLTAVLALAGCGEDAPASEPASEPAPEPAAIPDDFPLSMGMGGPEDTVATSRTGTGLRDLQLCGTTPLRGLGVRDRMVADNSGGESANTRELVLLGSPDEAAQVAGILTELSVRCEATASDGDVQIVTQVRESPFGPAPAATLLQTYTFDGEPGTGATVVHVVPVGSALLVTSTYGDWTGTALEDGVAETVEAVRGTVAAMASVG